MYKAKAQLNSIVLQITQQISQAKVMGALQKSTEIMKMMNEVMKVSEISETMRNMAKEMTKVFI